MGNTVYCVKWKISKFHSCHFVYFYSFINSTPELGGEYLCMCLSDCRYVSVCSVFTRISGKPHGRTSPNNFLCMFLRLYFWTYWSSCGGVTNTLCTSFIAHINVVGFYLVFMQLMLFSCVQ